jgi:hypothetical protein
MARKENAVESSAMKQQASSSNRYPLGDRGPEHMIVARGENSKITRGCHAGQLLGH